MPRTRHWGFSISLLETPSLTYILKVWIYCGFALNCSRRYCTVRQLIIAKQILNLKHTCSFYGKVVSILLRFPPLLLTPFPGWFGSLMHLLIIALIIQETSTCCVTGFISMARHDSDRLATLQVTHARIPRETFRLHRHLIYVCNTTL